MSHIEPSRVKLTLRYAALAAAFAISGGAARAADAIDPALQKSWDFMQQSMPGVPYDLLKAACAEKEITLYAGTWPDAERSQINAFNARFPCVQVHLYIAATPERRQRFLSEQQAGRYIADVLQDTDPGTLDNQAKTGILMNYALSNDKSYGATEKNSGFWYPIRLAVLGLAWNTTLVSDSEAKILSDWKGATDPTWKGRAGVADPSTGGASYLPWYVWPKLYGQEFVEKIGALKPHVFTAVNPAASSLASGDIAVFFGADETAMTTLWASGAPIHWSLPEPGIAVPTGQAVAAKAPHPSAAKLYQEFCFTEEGYGAWQKVGGGPPTRIGFKDQRKVASEAWYHFPTAFYSYETSAATKEAPDALAFFHKVVGTPY